MLDDDCRFVERRLLLVDDELAADHTHRSTSPALSDLIFTNYTSSISSHLRHSLYYMKETQGELNFFLSSSFSLFAPSDIVTLSLVIRPICLLI